MKLLLVVKGTDLVCDLADTIPASDIRIVLKGDDLYIYTIKKDEDYRLLGSHNHGKFTAQQDYKEVGAFLNPFRKHTNAWRGYHAEESSRMLIEIRGEEG